jgi:EPS-associated MarR family transcriptional regulator
MAKKPPEPPAHSQQLELMRLLDEQPAASQREISSRLGLSLGKANYLVRALLDKGLLKMQNFRRSDNKMAYAYYLTPRGAAERVRLTRAFLARKEIEFELLKTEIQSLQSQVEADSKSSARGERQG